MAFLLSDRGNWGIYKKIKTKKNGGIHYKKVCLHKIGTSTKREATKVLNNWIRDNIDLKYTDISFSSALNRFKRHLEAQLELKKLRNSSYDNHVMFIDNYIKFYFSASQIQIKDLDSEKIQEFTFYLKQQKDKRYKKNKKEAPSISDRTVNLCLNTLSLFLKFLNEKNIFSNYIKVNKIDTLPKEISRLNNNEIKTLLSHCNDKEKFYIEVLLHSGIRPYEFQNIHWEDVDFKKEMISYKPRDIYQNKYARPRKIKMSSYLKTILQKRATNIDKVDRLVSPYKTTKHARSLFRSLKRKTGIDTSSKVFRATFASIMAENGFPLDKLSHYMGNTPVILKQFYTELEAESFAADLKLINGVT